MIFDKKTPLQIEFEMAVTNGRSYLRVPYTNFFGKKNALKQWLRFSENSVYCLCNTSIEKVN